jgi:5-methylcytosine-specific restriction endonuclease McrA
MKAGDASMSDWVRFHREIRQGEKRGLARATRFVYMELSQEARGGRGEIVLPVGMSDEEGVHDILGGNRKEVIEAIRELAKGVDPMIRIETRGSNRVLVVVDWEKWNPPFVLRRRRRIPMSVRLMVLQRDGFICRLCGEPVNGSELHFDHRLPLSRGGSNESDNLQVTHATCNLEKGARLQ